MRKLWLIVLLALAGCSTGGAVTPAANVPAAPPPGEPRVVASGLSVPWGIAFLPGGDALVTERDSARLLRVTAQGKVTEVAKISEASPGGEGGLMGVAVKDDFVFLYYTAAEDNRIVRYRLSGDTIAEPKVLVDGIPKAGIHNGGRLAFGPDGFLYASTGEAGERPLAQDPDSLGGKILRMGVDGDARIYTLGHRNVQGMAWDEKGRMYASEFGASSFDEVNQIVEGRNYGWPQEEGQGEDAAFADPIVTWGTGEASPSGMAYAAGSLWVGALRGARLWQVPLDAEGRPGKPVAHFEDTYGRLRAVAVAPDGTLWVGTSNKDGRGSPAQDDDRILAVTPRRS
ncbi:PQQ-dependent sugar dehydrogenase [Nonomuraea endophytica]|uniref:Glucose/arabinose dehydrogenase n=1 Tax=Nonomuraea endophytica TaxID=714136 RepID=A0A7W8EEZ9_9ACTN|nr:PQQ-dependent sugar dehydrogenase [Nonomuraea endophytica]MBB5076913.1 glucose/arabinose dehydrogenase [Nonomuraea endophytica]